MLRSIVAALWHSIPTYRALFSYLFSSPYSVLQCSKSHSRLSRALVAQVECDAQLRHAVNAVPFLVYIYIVKGQVAEAHLQILNAPKGSHMANFGQKTKISTFAETSAFKLSYLAGERSSLHKFAATASQ
jgi:hypothetical protein